MQVRAGRFAALLCVVWLALCAPAGAQPNFVVIVLDDAGYNEFGFTSGDPSRTPWIDSVASGGIRFSDAYVTQPQCSPCRAGLLTGLYEQRFGYEHNPSNSYYQTDGLQPGDVLLSHRLKALGYTTGIVGKWHMGAVDGFNRPLNMGFDEFFGFLGGNRTYWGGAPGNAAWMYRQNTKVEDQWPFEGDPAEYDPVYGRYLTDALGEEAAAFIDRHARDPNPFFLYVALNAPHDPHEAKSQDLAMFPNLTGTAKLVAAMMLAADRAVGNVVQALDDNQIADSTVLLILNDNGGLQIQDNSPFRGYKGRTYEGGIRVPMCLRWPGLARGVTYASPVIGLDWAPTLVAAAGGDPTWSDGVDLYPYLSGQNGERPHEVLYFRHREEWAIRRGDWKLVRGNVQPPDVELFDLAADPSESDDRAGDEPAIVAELLSDLDRWEATVGKPRWGNAGNNSQINLFDHFRLAYPVAGPWSAPGVWRREATDTPATMFPADAYADAVVEIPLADGSFATVNDLARMTGRKFMLHELRLSGPTGAGAERSGSISGGELLFTTGRDGSAPAIELSADDPAFSFLLDNETRFLGPLELRGDGASPLVVAGLIAEREPGQSIVKRGASSVELRAPAWCTGPIGIEGGLLTVSGADAALDSGDSIDVGDGASLRIEGGACVEAPAVRVRGTLGGDGLLGVAGDLTLGPSATLVLTLGGVIPGEGFDQVVVAGSVALGGRLRLEAADGYVESLGDRYRVVDATARSGAFEGLEGAPADTRHTFRVEYDASGVEVVVGCPADFNGDGALNTQDALAFLNAWAGADGSADFNRDGAIDTRDVLAFLNAWAAGC